MATTADTQPALPQLAVTMPDAQLDHLALMIVSRVLDQLPHSGERRTGLSSAEAADYVGCSLEHLRDEAAAGKIARYQSSPGAPLRFDADDLDAYRLRHRIPASN